MKRDDGLRQLMTVWLVVLLVLSSTTAVRAADVIVPGYARFRTDRLSAPDAGRLLISELNCQSCHGSYPGLALPPRQAPILTDAGSRIARDHLRQFLLNPQQLKPGSPMPQLRKTASTPRTVDALVSFLAQDSTLRQAPIGTAAVQRGEALFHGIGCAACHADLRRPTDQQPSFLVPLGSLTSKYSVTSLTAFLLNPHAVRPSGRMPSLNLSPVEGRDLASYLLRDLTVEPSLNYEYFEGNWDRLPEFTGLEPAARGGATDFSVEAALRNDHFALRFSGFLQIPEQANYRFWLSSDDGSRLLIDGQTVIDHDGIHPNSPKEKRIALSAGPHELVLEYFEQQGEESLSLEMAGGGLARQAAAGLVTRTKNPPPVVADKSPLDSQLVSEGRILFSELGCAACHQHGTGDQQMVSSRKGPDFHGMDVTSGCLASDPAEAVPAYALSDQQRQDLQAAILALRSPAADRTPEAEVGDIMLALNCYACHQRAAMGGVPAGLNELFSGSIPEMGDEGRIPPSLDGAGDKLNAVWLSHVLKEGAKDRPYMRTRMPQFGLENVGRLAGLLETLDQKTEVPAVVMEHPDHRIKADARLMVGDQALSCIKCHSFDRYAATGIQAMDLTTMTRRLRRDWFHRYLLNPQAYRAGTRMPAAWPNGKSVVPQILDGRPAVQIEAIWTYLLDGKQARLPTGLQRNSIELKPIDRPIVYRNFLDGLSARGIAVGFPERAHVAWDAEHMTLRKIWHGAFIDASMHWEGRGPGRQVPLGDHVLDMPPGPPLAFLSTLEEKWPDGHPRELGFQFRGYRLNQEGIPTFRYTGLNREVRDELRAVAAVPDAELERRISVSPAAAADASSATSRLWLRLAVGAQIRQEGENWLVDDAVRYRFLAGKPVARRVAGGMELLVPVTSEADGAASRPTDVVYRIVW